MQKCGVPYPEMIMHFELYLPGPKLTVLQHGLNEKITTPLTISSVHFLEAGVPLPQWARSSYLCEGSLNQFAPGCFCAALSCLI